MPTPTPAPAGQPPAGQLRIGLLGMYRSANLGDVAIQMAIMQGLRERLAPVEFLGICRDPRDAAGALGIAAVQWWGDEAIVEPGAAAAPSAARSWNGQSRLTRVVERLRGIDRLTASLDLLVISGSGQIDDNWGGPWAQPLRLFLWCTSAQRNRVPLAVFGVGLDELASRLGAWFSVSGLNLAQFRAFRDAGSLERLTSLGLRGPSVVCPDPAFALSASRIPQAPASPAPYAVVSPIAREAWPGREDAAYDTYLRALAIACERLQGAGITVRFVSSQTQMDPPIAERVRQLMPPEAAGRCRFDTVAKVHEYVAIARGAELVIASRLHANILALVAGAPVVAIAPSRKVRQLMQDVGLPDHCIGLRDAETERVWEMTTRVLAERAALRRHIADRNRQMCDVLAASYDQLADTVLPGRRTSRAHAGPVIEQTVASPDG